MPPNSRTSSHFAGQYHRYRLKREIASDRTGTVWEGEDTALRRPVTVRLFSESLSGDERFVDGYRTGLRAVFPLLEHPRVAQVINYNYGEDGPTQFAVMEPIAGESLAERLQRQGTLDPQEALRIAGGIAEALRAAHRLDLVHGGLRPESVMLTASGDVKLIDFGVAEVIARIGFEDSDAERSVHTSPEQAAGGEPTSASDVYAMAVLLYQMVLGKTPVIDEPPPAGGGVDVDELIPLIGNSIGQLCKRALDWNPDSRPSTSRFAWALKEELEKAPKPEAAQSEAAPQEAEREQVELPEAARKQPASLEAAKEEPVEREAELRAQEPKEDEAPEVSRQKVSRRAARQERREQKARQKQAEREAREAARQEAAAVAAREEAARQQAARLEAERKEAERHEAARQVAARQEAKRKQREREKAERREAKRRERARQKEEGKAGAEKREAEPAEAKQHDASKLRRRTIAVLSVGTALVVALALVIVARSL